MKHDPYCPVTTDGNWPGVECLCDLIRDVEARAVQRVEALWNHAASPTHNAAIQAALAAIKGES